LLEKNNDGDFLVIKLRNLIRNRFLLFEKKCYIISFLVGGFDFGERALVTNEPRSATVMTITPTDLLVVDREVFSRYVKLGILFICIIFLL